MCYHRRWCRRQDVPAHFVHVQRVPGGLHSHRVVRRPRTRIPVSLHSATYNANTGWLPLMLPLMVQSSMVQKIADCGCVLPLRAYTQEWQPWVGADNSRIAQHGSRAPDICLFRTTVLRQARRRSAGAFWYKTADAWTQFGSKMRTDVLCVREVCRVCARAGGSSARCTRFTKNCECTNPCSTVERWGTVC